jgi:hypothetical protein
MESYSIWSEAEQWAQVELDPDDCNSDVMASFEKGGEWVATFSPVRIFQVLQKRIRSQVSV